MITMYYESSVNSVTSAVWAVNSEVLPPYLMVFFLQKLTKKNRCAYKNSQKTQLTHNRALCFGFPSHCSFGRGFWKFATILRKICIHVEKNHFIGEIISRLSALLTESRQEEELRRGESSLASQKIHVLSLSGLTKLGKGSRPIFVQLLVNLFQYFQVLQVSHGETEKTKCMCVL